MLPKKNITNRPHFSRSLHKQNQTHHKKQYSRILPLILHRLFSNTLKFSYNSLIKYTHLKSTIFHKLLLFSQKKNTQTKLWAWKKLLRHQNNKMRKKYIMKSIYLMCKNYRRRMLMEGMSKIKLFRIKRNVKMNYGGILFEKIKRLYKCRMRNIFQFYAQFLRKKQIKYEKMRSLNKWWKYKQKDHILSFWMRILRDNKKINEQSLKLNLNNTQSLKLQNKYKNISSARSWKERSEKSSSKCKSEERQERKFDTNTSTLSWLNNSFFTIKSSHSIIPDCTKCIRLKGQFQSLHKQVQIIKKELQVSKEINQHLENQMFNLYQDSTENSEIKRLRQQLKKCQKQKQVLQEKVLKSKKYIINLKTECKIKFQNLYRSFKKNSHY